MKTPLQLLMDHLDPIHEGLRLKIIELMTLEKYIIKKAYIDGRLESGLQTEWKKDSTPEDYFDDKFGPLAK